MDKNAIKKFAVWARRELIARVLQKALQYGIAANTAEPEEATSINGKVLSAEEIRQRRALLKQVQSKGYEQVMEEVAYTWFNRFCALRFMEVNQYLPSRVRVFTNEEDAFKPQMIDEALSLELEGLSMDAVYAYKEANDKEGLFKYLLITRCNALSPVLPQMFQHIADYTELLFPDNLLREGSVIHEMVTSIPTEDWQDAVQIIGWLYQYYNSEKKDEVFANLKKNVKITKDNIPAATQLFTPDWIVRYMVENSLGRLWVEGHPNEELKQQWRYFLEEAEQEPEVQAQLADIRKEYAAMKPEDIKCIDPCCGSGHILAYMFDVLVQIYEACGYTTRDAVRSIIEKNIYGLDIDDRAAQLAYFAVMMKARQYDRRFLTRKDEEDKPDVPQPKVYAICESNSIDEQALEYFANGDAGMYFSLQTIVRELHDAKEYGSLIKCTPLDYGALYTRAEAIRKNGDMQGAAIVNEILPLIRVAETLALKYDAVVTNPPYMGAGNADKKLSFFISDKFTSSKNDLYTAFVERSFSYLTSLGIASNITMQAWMYQSSFEKFRLLLSSKSTCINMLHLGTRAFDDISGEVVQVAAFVYTAKKDKRYKTSFRDLRDGKNSSEKRSLYFSHVGEYIRSVSDFDKFGGIYNYSASEAIFNLYGNHIRLSEYADIRQGIATGDIQRFTRLWHEVSLGNISFHCSCREDAKLSRKKWFPYNKGGSFKKWYGNNDYILNWEYDGYEICNFKNETGKLASRPQNLNYFFRPCITWSQVASCSIAFRLKNIGFCFDVTGPSIFSDDSLHVLLGWANSKVVDYLLRLSSSLHYNILEVANLPLIIEKNSHLVLELADQCIGRARKDWDSFEISWDFKRHPLLRGLGSVQASYEAWEREASERFYQLKANEEELNRIFIDIYGLQDELTPEVEEKDVTVRKADLGRDIRSLISYAVGCMFGRYSLDEEGLAYAGGNWDASKYSSFPADADNIIPICDDEYFEDDIVGRFVEFVRVAYGEESLEENLRYIADALGGKGSAREVIRKYFRDDFYADHLKIYQKRPIYWQFDSGKKGGFRALVYMHRYAPDTIARIRTDYVHQQQDRYRTALEGIEQRMANADTGERVKLSKVQKKLQEQDKELHEYEEKIHHLADQYISIDLDDGVKKNYALFSDVLTKIK
ncbi:MAG: BREX-1 system adenine-specific DNA-methyltransferase PglX [Akkermansiaceae bacterium]|nr:BREX-1 system adenine-specific DNA-methyltransferase PglX [Akkermansiaceae bacterium]